MTEQEKEKIISGYMAKLDLNRQEAEQLFEDDNSDEMLPEVAEMTAKAKENCKIYVRGDKKRTPTKKERKIDNTKKYLLSLFQNVLPTTVQNVSIKTETELNFDFEGEKYTVKLTKHRPPKK